MPSKIIKFVDCSNVVEGEIFKNYTDLCNALNDKPKSGNAKIAQLENWNRFFEYERDGHQWIITKIYDEPEEPSLDLKYYDAFRSLLLINIFRYAKDHPEEVVDDKAMEIALPRSTLHKEFGFCNYDFNNRKKEIDDIVFEFQHESDQHQLPRGDINMQLWKIYRKESWENEHKSSGLKQYPNLLYIEQSFFRDTENKYNRIIDQNLAIIQNLEAAAKNLISERIVSVFEPYAIRLILEDPHDPEKRIHRFATGHEADEIVLAESAALKKMNIKSKYNLFNDNDQDAINEYNEYIKEFLEEKGVLCGYIGHYKAIKIRCVLPNVENAIQEMTKNTLNTIIDDIYIENKRKLNRIVTDAVIDSAIAKANKFFALSAYHTLPNGQIPSRSQMYSHYQSVQEIREISIARKKHFENLKESDEYGNCDIHIEDEPEWDDNTKSRYANKNTIIYFKKLMSIVLDYIECDQLAAEKLRQEYLECDDNKLLDIIRSL